MFKFLKEKIKKAVSNISKKVEETEEPSKEVKEEEKKEEPKVEETIEKEEKPKEKKKSIVEKFKEKVVTKKISESKFDELFYQLEIALLENNVASEVIEKIKEDLKDQLVDKPLKRKEVSEIIFNSLKESIDHLFDQDSFDLLKEIKKNKPYVILFVGVNGSGKTTTIAKLARKLTDNNLSCVLAAADTWRQAAIEQLEEHGKKLNLRVIKHDYGSDPTAVAFDAVKHAKARNIDVVLIDTAGRLHSNKNLIDEMKKIERVIKPNLKIFVGESITGNDCVEQAKQFNKAIGIDAIILTKADVDEKGGAAVSISYVIKKPIIYLGKGQSYKDLEEFKKEEIIESIGL